MSLLPMSLLGAHETSPGVIQFGLYLPNVTPATGASLVLEISYEDDQLVGAVPPLKFPLANIPNPAFPGNDYWTVTVDTTTPPPQPLPASARWGNTGTYVYSYSVTPSGKAPITCLVDPYAREYGVGDLSAITVGFSEHTWSAKEATWRTPKVKDLIIYELMISEFGFDIAKTIPLLDYLADLGVNAIEVMPVSNVKTLNNWGYDVMGFFGVDERFGNRADFQHLVDEAHQRGIAVIVDVVYGHTAWDFIFPTLYPQLGVANPFNGASIQNAGYGPKPDFSQTFVQDFFYTVNQLWLDKFHVDGFRYDNLPAFWDKAKPKNAYGALVAATYDLAATNSAAGGGPNYWQRFAASAGEVNLIQCAEYLDDPPAVLNNTRTNSIWQDWTLNAAQHCSTGQAGAISDLGQRFGLLYFPTRNTVDGIQLEQTALQYIENHDQSRFICQYGIDNPNDAEVLWQGNRDRWFKVQPYLIALLAAKGVPFLWEGQESCQTYYVPPPGSDRGQRPYIFRPVDWAKFYDPTGQSLLTLVRKLVSIRNGYPQFRSDDYYFYDSPYYTNAGLLVFSRSLAQAFSMVVVNFTDSAVRTTIMLPPGTYKELIDGNQGVVSVDANAPISVTIPSNYGQIWTK